MATRRKASKHKAGRRSKGNGGIVLAAVVFAMAFTAVGLYEFAHPARPRLLDGFDVRLLRSLFGREGPALIPLFIAGCAWLYAVWIMIGWILDTLRRHGTDSSHSTNRKAADASAQPRD
jgi:hypothetical protein